MALTPTFDKNVKEYSVKTTNASNTITAVAENPEDDVVITVNNEIVESGTSVTWDAGVNDVKVTVGDTTYYIVVTK